MQSTAIRSHTSRMPFVAAGAVTGIGSLPLTSIAGAVRCVAELSRKFPFGLNCLNSQNERVSSARASVLSKT